MTALDLEPTELLPEGAAPERRQLLLRGSFAIWVAAAWLLLVAVLAIFASLLPWLPDPYEIDPYAIRESPSLAHPMGTDNLGRDILSRCIYGARSTAVVAFSALAIGLVVGGGIGMLAGYFRGKFESIVLAVTDVLLAFPGLILMLAILSFIGQSTRNVALVLGLSVIPGFIRIVRASTIQVNERLFVLSARTLGASHGRVVLREIAPNIAPPIAGISLLVLGVIVVAEGGLGFLGLGVPLPTPTWGGMIAGGLPDIETSPHITFMPAAVLFVTVLAFNVLGERLRIALEPRESRL